GFSKMVKNVLWTGGWDSTFRILDLVLSKKESVQPFYILDSDRNSTPLELKIMDKIKKLILEINPQSKDRIFDHIMININNLQVNDDSTYEYNFLQIINNLGRIFFYLSRYLYTIYMYVISLRINIDNK